ncbi:MAG: DUF4199 domain-containing protein [Flavobacteriales bacterium]|nr:DUF4199 domain-containing protein [Flavobacteriales bacterium]
MLAISMLMKMLVFAGGYQFTDYEKIYFFGNLFIIMVGTFLGIRLFKNIHVEKTTFLADVKAGMKVAGMYAVLMSFFVYVYYTYIDVDYFEIKLSRQLELMAESGADKLALNQARKTGGFVLSPYFQSTVTLILYLLFGSFYASIITFFVRKVRNER